MAKNTLEMDSLNVNTNTVESKLYEQSKDCILVFYDDFPSFIEALRCPW